MPSNACTREQTSGDPQRLKKLSAISKEWDCDGRTVLHLVDQGILAPPLIIGGIRRWRVEDLQRAEAYLLKEGKKQWKARLGKAGGEP
jgi:hypothetical protein